MKHIYLVWYYCKELSTTRPVLWGIFSTKERADAELAILEKDFNYTCFCNEEPLVE